MTTLAAICEEHGVGTIDFLKIDVEGAEASILRGATRVLEELGPRLLIEMHAPELIQECIALLRSRGYTSIESVAPGVFAASKAEHSSRRP